MTINKSQTRTLNPQPIVAFIYNGKPRIVRVEVESKNGWFRGEVLSESEPGNQVFKTFTLEKVQEGTLRQTGSITVEGERVAASW